MEVALPYKALYTTTDKRVIMYSPRVSGKSKAVAQYLAYMCAKHPGRDILVARANYNALGDSLFQEILEVQNDIGLPGFFHGKANPLRMTTPFGNNILFKGVGGADYSRTRGIKSAKKDPDQLGGNFALVFIDEVQQLKSELSLAHAIATFMRNLSSDPDSKIVIAGNPHEVKGHWWNVYCRKMRHAPGYTFIDATYQDIVKYLPEDTIEDIELMREINPAQYKFMYLGSLDELQGGAYGQFNRDRHFITEAQASKLFAGERIHYVIFGGDGAVTHDATCICPIAILDSGRALVLERFFYDPIASGQVLAPTQLVDLIVRYLQAMEAKYRFSEMECDKIFAIDCAAADLITQLRYVLDDSWLVKAYTNKAVIRNNSVVNDAFARNVLYIKDMGGQYLWHNGKTMQDDPLVVQLESVVWKNYKLDPAIPNDCTDALTYGVNYYFENPDNLAFPQIQKYYKNG